MSYDLYDARVAFDDWYARADERPDPDVFDDLHGYATDTDVSTEDIAYATRNVLRNTRARRLAVPVRFEPVSADTTAASFQVDKRYCVGFSTDFSNTWAEVCPIYMGALHYFRAAMPAPKFVRADTPASYAHFREVRRIPYRDGLSARLRARESALAQRAVDRHQDDEFEFGDYPNRDVDVLGAEVAHAAQLYMDGGTSIPVVPALEGKVMCWQDGEEICCTVRFLNSRGDLSLITTGTPVQRHLNEVLRCVSAEELECILPVLDRLVQVLGSTLLIPELCRATSIFSTTDAAPPMIGVMFAQSVPETAAAMALLQRCQQGDLRARNEVCVVAECGGVPLLAEARERLLRAQEAKARRGL